MASFVKEICSKSTLVFLDFYCLLVTFGFKDSGISLLIFESTDESSLVSSTLSNTLVAVALSPRVWCCCDLSHVSEVLTLPNCCLCFGTERSFGPLRPSPESHLGRSGD